MAERPEVIGLAVPGMPLGSPGMDTQGAQSQPYDVLTFDAQGNSEIFASYRIYLPAITRSLITGGLN